MVRPGGCVLWDFYETVVYGLAAHSVGQDLGEIEDPYLMRIRGHIQSG